jgi:hypothetical protein
MNWFALRIGLCNAIGFGAVVAAAIYVDSNIHHSIYGIREYPFGYGTVFLSPIILIITYAVNIAKIGYHKKFIYTFLCFMLPITILLFTTFFKPIFPHPSVLAVSLLYSTIIALTVLIKNYEISDRFLYSESISEGVKLEKVKLEYDFWFKSFITILTGYSLWALYFIYNFSLTYPTVTNIKNEIILLGNVFNMAFTLSLFFFSLLCLEFVKKLFAIREMLLKVPKDKKDTQMIIPT